MALVLMFGWLAGGQRDHFAIERMEQEHSDGVLYHISSRECVCRLQWAATSVPSGAVRGVGLKPRESRNMTLNLKGEKAPLGNEIGSLLAADLQNATAVMLTVSIAARWMRNDRKAAWMGMNCDVAAKTPPISSGGFVYGFCTRF